MSQLAERRGMHFFCTCTAIVWDASAVPRFGPAHVRFQASGLDQWFLVKSLGDLTAKKLPISHPDLRELWWTRRERQYHDACSKHAHIGATGGRTSTHPQTSRSHSTIGNNLSASSGGFFVRFGRRSTFGKIPAVVHSSRLMQAGMCSEYFRKPCTAPCSVSFQRQYDSSLHSDSKPPHCRMLAWPALSSTKLDT